MKHVFLALICCMILAVGQVYAKGTVTSDNSIVTHEFLISKGFINKQGIYYLPPMQIKDSAAILGFKLNDMHQTPGQPINSDVRIVKVRNLWFVVRSMEKDANGKVIPSSLENPNALAEVSVSLHQIPPEQERWKNKAP